MTVHFAYGSNMSRTLMTRRCPDATAIGVGSLDGFRVIVNDDGYATIVPAPGGVVQGVLWRVSLRDRAALNSYERLDIGLYRAVVLPVRFGAKRVPALTYVGRSRREGRPKPGYHALVLDAARAAGLPEDYVRSLARLAPTGFAGARARDCGEFA